MTDLIEEVANDLRSEKFFLLVKKITKIFLGCAALILIITAAYVYYTHAYQNKQMALSVDYYHLINSKNNQENYNKYLNKLDNKKAGIYAQLAAVNHAKMLLKAGKQEEAFSSLIKLYQQDGNDITMKNAAQILILNQALADQKITPEILAIAKSTTKQPYQEISQLLKAQYLAQSNESSFAISILQELITKSEDDNITYLAKALISNMEKK